MRIFKIFKKIDGKIPDGKFCIEKVPFFSQRLDEKNFKAEGFLDLKEASHWSERACGIACIKMVIKAFIPESDITLKTILDYGLQIEAYREDVGWFHNGLINIASKFGIFGERESIGKDLEKIARHIIDGKLVVASVTVGFEAGKRYNRDDGSSYVMPRGGHLVLVYGCEVQDGKVNKLLLHHPSSWELYEWENHEISKNDFLKSFSKKGNIIYFGFSK